MACDYYMLYYQTSLQEQKKGYSHESSYSGWFKRKRLNRSAGLYRVDSRLKARGWEIEHVQLCETKIGNCAGDFFCWIRNPGLCNVNDANRLIAASIANCQLLVYLTPITFGGYSSSLKKMVDHQIQNVLPFFQQVNGETHHQKRYPAYPDFLAIGWMDQPDAQTESIFRHLAYRNSINFYAKKFIAGVVFADQTESADSIIGAELAGRAESRKKNRAGEAA